MLKMKKIILASIMMLTLSMSSVVMASSTNIKQIKQQRIAGALDRYDTSASVVDYSYDNKPIDTVILASGKSFPDGLGAAILSKKYNAPILLTEGKEHMELFGRITLSRLGAKNIIILGGTGVISSKLEDSLKASNYIVRRISGIDRYETAIKISDELSNVNSIIVANGDDFAGALSVAPMAGIKQIPILLVGKDKLPSSVSDYIKAHSSIKTSYVIGDSSVINDSVVASMPNVQRISGNDCYSINRGVINQFKSDFNFEEVVVASGDGFADALSGVGYAVKRNSPIVFLSKSDNSKTKQLLSDKKIYYAMVIGGEKIAPSGRVQELFDIPIESFTISRSDDTDKDTFINKYYDGYLFYTNWTDGGLTPHFGNQQYYTFSAQDAIDRKIYFKNGKVSYDGTSITSPYFHNIDTAYYKAIYDLLKYKISNHDASFYVRISGSEDSLNLGVVEDKVHEEMNSWYIASKSDRETYFKKPGIAEIGILNLKNTKEEFKVALNSLFGITEGDKVIDFINTEIEKVSDIESRNRRGRQDPDFNYVDELDVNGMKIKFDAHNYSTGIGVGYPFDIYYGN